MLRFGKLLIRKVLRERGVLTRDRVWDNWLSERLKRHSKTDSRIELRAVRLAADGVWLERIMTAKSKNLKGVKEYLSEMTRIR
jgi:hypothetical protein